MFVLSHTFFTPSVIPIISKQHFGMDNCLQYISCTTQLDSIRLVDYRKTGRLVVHFIRLTPSATSRPSAETYGRLRFTQIEGLSMNEIISDLKLRMNRQYMKLLSLCVLSCIIIYIYSVLLIGHNPYNVKRKRINGTETEFCYEEIINILKAIKFDENVDVDVNVNTKALDLLVSGVQTWLETKRYKKKIESSLDFWKLHTIQDKLNEENFHQNARSKFAKEEKEEEQQQEQKEREGEINELLKKGTLNIQNKVTILLNFKTYRNKNLEAVKYLLTDLTRMFPGVSVVVNKPRDMLLGSTSKSVRLFSMNDRSNPAQIWSHLVEQVKTKYVLIMRDVISIDAEIDLANMLKKLLTLKAGVVGGAIKNVYNGHWYMGCYQSYHLVYKSGYRHSEHSCVYCHSISGPFLTSVSTIEKFRLTEGLKDQLMFQDFFLKLVKNKSKIAVCPGYMFTMRKTPLSLKRKQWLPFTIRNDAHRITTYENNTRKAPFCTVLELANHVKFIMRLCRKHLIVCELSYGAELEAVKSNGLPSRDLDVNLSFFAPQAREIWDLKSTFEEMDILCIITITLGHGTALGLEVKANFVE